MIDMHAHILPGIDDGSPDMEQSLAMAALAVEGGTRHLVATPHSNQAGRFENYASDGRLGRLFRSFRRELDRADIPLTVSLGMEIFASDDMYEKIRDHRLIGLNGSRYYLVEFHFDEDPLTIHRHLMTIFRAGGVPLIAHPERYFCVQDTPALIYEWLQMGCLAQINKGSLFGRFGRDAMRTADTLLFNGLVSCIGSDAHSPYQRTTHMRDTELYLREHLGPEIAHLLTEENPTRILNNRPVETRGRLPGAEYYQ